MKKKVKLVPDSVKGTGFYTPMDLVPGEYSTYGQMFAELKAHNLAVIKEHYGKRCKTKDYEDFPELEPLFAVGDPDDGRCSVCLVYEKFDAYWKYLYDDTDDL